MMMETEQRLEQGLDLELEEVLLPQAKIKYLLKLGTHTEISQLNLDEMMALYDSCEKFNQLLPLRDFLDTQERDRRKKQSEIIIRKCLHVLHMKLLASLQLEMKQERVNQELLITKLQQKVEEDCQICFLNQADQLLVLYLILLNIGLIFVGNLVAQSFLHALGSNITHIVIAGLVFLAIVIINCIGRNHTHQPLPRTIYERIVPKYFFDGFSDIQCLQHLLEHPIDLMNVSSKEQIEYLFGIVLYMAQNLDKDQIIRAYDNIQMLSFRFVRDRCRAVTKEISIIQQENQKRHKTLLSKQDSGDFFTSKQTIFNIVGTILAVAVILSATWPAALIDEKLSPNHFIFGSQIALSVAVFILMIKRACRKLKQHHNKPPQQK